MSSSCTSGQDDPGYGETNSVRGSRRESLRPSLSQPLSHKSLRCSATTRPGLCLNRFLARQSRDPRLGPLGRGAWNSGDLPGSRCWKDRIKECAPENGVFNEIPDADLEVVARLPARANELPRKQMGPAISRPERAPNFRIFLAWTGTGQVYRIGSGGAVGSPGDGGGGLHRDRSSSGRPACTQLTYL